MTSTEIKGKIDEIANSGHPEQITYFQLLSIAQHLVQKLTTGNYYETLIHEKDKKVGEISELKVQINEKEGLSEEFERLAIEEERLINELNNDDFKTKRKAKEDCEKRITELKGIKEAISNHDIAALKKEIHDLENNISGDYQRFVQLIAKANEQLQNINGLVESNPSVATLKQNCETLKKQTNDILGILSEDFEQLSSIVGDEEGKLEKQRYEYNACLDKLKHIKEELKLIEENHPKNLEIWKKHFESNEKVWGGLADRSKTSEYANELKINIEKQLKNFDESIAKIVRENDKIVFYEYAKKSNPLNAQ